MPKRAATVNTRFRSHELAGILQRSRSRVLVFWPQFKGMDFAGILAACDPLALERLQTMVAYDEAGVNAPTTVLGKATLSYALLAGGAPLPENRATPDTGCAIFTTSGTTKAPKFVLHDQRTVIRHAFDVVKGFSIDGDATTLLAPPLCGVFGYAAFNPAQADIVQRADARGLKLVGLYGASEIQALFAHQDENARVAERMLAGGLPVSAQARVRVRDPESGAILAHGASGELEFFAPSSRMMGYHGNPDATAAAFTADGYYRSGDLGTTSADGRFVFLTRMGDALRLGGFLVSPAEIEAVVQEAPGVAACQVVGVPRAEGLVPVAFVILHQGAVLDEAGVAAHVASRLARYKIPRRVLAIDAFPVTPGANATKIQKGKLREMAEALLH